MRDVTPGFTAKAPPSGVQSDLISMETGLPGLSTQPGFAPLPGSGDPASPSNDGGVGQGSPYSSGNYDCLPPLLFDDASDGDRRNGSEAPMPAMLPGPPGQGI